MRKMVLLLALLAGLTACGSDYDPDLCAIWTDLYHGAQTGDNRVQMDKYCTR